MYEITELEIRKIKPKKLAFYRGMIRQGYKYLFDNPDLLDPSNKNLMAVTATLHHTPVGLVIGEKKPGHLLEIKSLFIDEGHKNKNLLFRMLKFLEKEYVKNGGLYMQAMYAEEPLFLEEWEKTFTQLGWTAKRLAAVECFYEDGYSFHPPWLDKNYVLHPDFEIFLWKELTAEEAEAIKLAYKKRLIPEEVYPFSAGGLFEPMNSLGLRYKGKVVGWLITRRYDPDTICYYSIYTDLEFHHKGPIIKLLVHSLKLQQKSSFKKAIFRVNVIQLPNLKWLKFIRRRLVPYTTKTTEYSLAWHVISSTRPHA